MGSNYFDTKAGTTRGSEAAKSAVAEGLLSGRSVLSEDLLGIFDREDGTLSISLYPFSRVRAARFDLRMRGCLSGDISWIVGSSEIRIRGRVPVYWPEGTASF